MDRNLSAGNFKIMESLHASQNADGGWPYRPGSSSWIEPTVYALLAGYACGDDTGRARALDWIRSTQRADGGWAPQPKVAQTTWVTALCALLPPADLGQPAHARAIQWLLDITAPNATYLARAKAWLSGGARLADPDRGWPWFPGTAAWVTPTAIATLALAKYRRGHADATVQARGTSGRRFLLTHRCADGGWNHGANSALGIDAPSYPETTGAALLALTGEDGAVLRASLARAEAWWNDCQSCEGASWLMLGLRAHGRPRIAPQRPHTPRTVQDAALKLLADAGDSGIGVFIG